MTLLTPTFAELKTNGAAGAPLHVLPAHEPTREGEVPPPPGAHPGSPAPAAVVTPAPAAPLKVAMVGTAPSSRMLAPYADPSWKIWACSPGNMNTLPRVDVWFELHSNLLWPEYESYGKPYVEWLKQQKFPIYMQELWPKTDGSMQPLKEIVPNATVFPVNEMVAEFGDEFFTSSFAWMMALAISQGATEIALYGIDMASRDEYILQRPGFYYFKREALKRGIRVAAPHESDIMQSPALYAFVDSTPFGRKLAARRQEIVGRVQQFDQQIGHATSSKQYLQGALEDLDYINSIWSGVGNDMGRIQWENKKLTTRMEELEKKIAELTATPKIEFAPVSAQLVVQPAEPLVEMPPPNPEPQAPRRRARRK